MYSHTSLVYFDARGNEVAPSFTAAAAVASVSVTAGLPIEVDITPIFPNALGGTSEPSALNVKVPLDVWEHNRGQTKRFLSECVRALYEVNHQLNTRALRERVADKAWARAGWKSPDQAMPQYLLEQAPSQPVAQPQLNSPSSPDRLGEVLKHLADIANRPIEVNVAPPNLTIAEGAVQVAITHPRPGDLEIQFPDGRKTRVKRT